MKISTTILICGTWEIEGEKKSKDGFVCWVNCMAGHKTMF